MSYLSCPNCGLTVFDRNPLESPRHCPRCARRGATVDLEAATRVRGRAAASLLGRQQPKAVERAEQSGG
jgi:endogenous inhibitor of DNA gyrase (YacG/DUF329 family)